MANDARAIALFRLLVERAVLVTVVCRVHIVGRDLQQTAIEEQKHAKVMTKSLLYISFLADFTFILGSLTQGISFHSKLFLLMK